MSYSHGQMEETLAKGVSLATAAVIGTLAPGYQPVKVTAAALVFTTTPNAAGAVEIRHRPTAGSVTGQTVVATLNYDATLGAAGNVVYADDFSQMVYPGEELVFAVSDATPTAGNAHCVAFKQHAAEHPSNRTNMAETA